MYDQQNIMDDDLSDEGRHRGEYHTFLWDAIIIGAGAAGAVFASELTKAGMNVLMLEMGRHYQSHRTDFAENELAMWERVWSNAQYNVTGNGFTGAPNLGIGVGGGTLAWTAVSLRFFNHDFKARSTYGQPTGSSVEDWPITLSELEPFYDKAERQLGVSGEISPWDSPSRRSPPNPPFGYYRSSHMLKEGMTKLGIRSAPGPVAINSRNHGNRSSCLHCGFCRSGCRVDAKYQADQVLIKQALATNRLKLLTGVAVTRINQGRSPRLASSVTYVDTSTRSYRSVRGRVIIAANNPIEIPRLFLNSASASHPNGLGNRYGNVGRNFFTHPATVGLGITNECVNGSIGYNIGNIISLDFCRSRNPRDYIGGFALESLNGAGAGVMAVDPYRHLWGNDLKNAMKNYNNALFSIAFCEGLPVRDNRITIDPNRQDAYGANMANIHYELHPNDLRVFAEAVQTTRKIMGAAGAHTVHVTETPFEAHPAGTMRMGNDKRVSVTDKFGRVHGLDNVYVGGSALFVTGSSVNPTLTLHALALHTAQHIKARYGAHRNSQISSTQST